MFTAYRETMPSAAAWLLDPEGDDIRKAKGENALMESPLKALLKKLAPRFNTLAPLKPLRTRRTIGDEDAHRKGTMLGEQRGAQTPKDRKRDAANRLAGVLGGMRSNEEGHHIEHGRNLETARSRAKQREDEDRKLREQESKLDRPARLRELEEFEKANRHLFE